MRLFPYPNNPYDPLDGDTDDPLRGPSARQRTAWSTTFLTPFDISMVSGTDHDDEPDLQDTILPETLMLRDQTALMPWLFASRRILHW